MAWRAMSLHSLALIVYKRPASIAFRWVHFIFPSVSNIEDTAVSYFMTFDIWGSFPSYHFIMSFLLIEWCLAVWALGVYTQYLMHWSRNYWLPEFIGVLLSLFCADSVIFGNMVSIFVLHQSLLCSFGDILLNRLLDVLAQSLSVPILKLLALRVHSTSLVSLSVFAMLIQWYLAIQVPWCP